MFLCSRLSESAPNYLQCFFRQNNSNHNPVFCEFDTTLPRHVLLDGPAFTVLLQKEYIHMYHINPPLISLSVLQFSFLTKRQSGPLCQIMH